jgi:uncharacterized protein (TIGR02599 family)
MNYPTASPLNRQARRGRPGFTIVEMLVSTAILGLLMVPLLSTVDQTQRVWLRTSNKLSQFQAARTAFEAMTRNLSQATLNTYYSLAVDKNNIPTLYQRESDLHFISGKAATAKLLGEDEATYPTHAVFFQAPIGWTSEVDTRLASDEAKKYRALNSMLSAVGYYIQWGRDESVPDFIKAQPGLLPDRYRFRLMEVIQPAESLGIFLDGEVTQSTPYRKTTDWIQVALGRMKRPDGRESQASSRILAENIVALVLLPKLSEADRRNKDTLDLAPEYDYDTQPSDASGILKREVVTSTKPGDKTGTYGVWKERDLRDVERKQLGQLPPIMQVTMVAIDEASATRQQDIGGETPPEWTQGLFTSVHREDDFKKDLGNSADPEPGSLIYRLQNTNKAVRVNHRVYTADVVIRGAKWSTDKN